MWSENIDAKFSFPWKVPRDLESKRRKWAMESPYVLEWFQKWIHNPKKPFLGHSDKQSIRILRDFGYPGQFMPRNPDIPEELKKFFPRTVELTDPDCGEWKIKYEQLKGLQEKAKCVDESCEKLEEVISKLQEEISYLRIQNESLRSQNIPTPPPPPPPVFVTPKEVQEAKTENREDRKAFLNEVQKGTLLKKTDIPAKTQEQNPAQTLTDALASRRKAIVDFEEEENNSEWDDADCRICGMVSDLTCSTCRRVRYCSAQCQANDWAEHRIFCASQ